MNKNFGYRNNNNKFYKFLSLILFLFGIAIADKGAEKYRNKGAALNNVSFSTTFIPYKLRSGFVYESSSLISQQINNNNMIVNTFLITYKKGNIFYIIPYKLAI